MSRAFSAVVDSDESAIDPSTAPTTPDGSLSFSPVLQAAQLLDAFDGRIGDQTRPGRGSSATLDLDGTAPMVVRNICCVGAGYVGELRPNYVLLSCPSKIDSLGVN
jgi:UDPglucose 6-dehydrogenase